MNICTHPAAPRGTKSGPWPGCGRRHGPRPGAGERLTFALGANLLERGADTWAGDMLSPDGRQVGTSGPWFNPKPGYTAEG